MLLNELQRQSQELRGLRAENAALAERLVRLEQAIPRSTLAASR
jgi:hypothetical protein